MSSRMQRTYGRRALRRRSGQDDDEQSPPRKRHKVYVEIVSPKKRSCSASPTHTPRGSVVKRMLGRFKTDPSLQASPTPLLETPPRQDSSHSLPTTFPERETTPEASTQSPKPLPTRNIRTYAGSSRSFIVALPVPDTDLLNAVEDDTEPHESYADLRTRWGIDMSEDDPQPYQDEHSAAPTPLRRTASEISQSSLPTGMMNDLKSITELRSKGESRRFLDEVGYLFEGLDSSSAIGLRRASAFEIVNKLCDPDFNRRAKTSDFYTLTWDKLRAARAGTSDKIFDATITFFAALAARDPRILTEVAQQQEFIPILLGILNSFDHSKDILASVPASDSDDDLKSHGILRTEITALKSLARLASKESRISFFSQPLARFFVSHSLATLPPSLLADQHLPTLLVNLRSELGLLEPRITAYESGLPLLPSTGVNCNDIPSFYHIEACLRLLDSYLLGNWTSSSNRSSSGLSHIDGFTLELTSLCVASSSLLEENEEEVVIGTVVTGTLRGSNNSPPARRSLCGAMRVLTLLSHDDPWWCSAALEVSYALPFVTTIVMQSQARWSESQNTELQCSSVESFDLLCLALGLVMNWAALSPKVALLSRMKSINPACSGYRPCVRTCRCADQKSILECFATLHVRYSDARQDDPPECAFLRGYTAILLGLLIKDDPSNQTLVMSTLPGISPSTRMKSLISHCHSFLDLYNDTIPLPSSDSPRATPEEVTYEASGRHRATWDKKGEQIARSVIASLETLCDT